MLAWQGIGRIFPASAAHPLKREFVLAVGCCSKSFIMDVYLLLASAASCVCPHAGLQEG